MARVTLLASRMKKSGMPEERIVAKIREQARHLDDRSLQLIFRKAIGEPTEDTLTEDELSHERPVKPGTVEIDLKEDRKDISIGSVLQFRGEFYTVTRLTKTGYVIKIVQ